LKKIFVFFFLFSFLFALNVGVNYYDSFMRVIRNCDKSYIKGFKYLNENNLTVVRINGSGFYSAKDWKYYLNNKTEYFKLLDEYIAYAEKNKIKLVFDFFWKYNSIPKLMHENIKQAYLNENSKTYKFMKKYIYEVITRYKNSPAIYMWEMGNEYNLKINMPCKKIKKYYKKCNKNYIFTLQAYKKLSQTFVDYVKTLDKNHQISSGNSIPRGFVYGKIKPTNFRFKLKDIILNETKYFDVVSIHIYPNNLKSRKYIRYFGNLESFLLFIKQTTKKPLFVGEFGACKIKRKNRYKYIEKYLKTFKNIDVKDALVWVYDKKKNPECNIDYTIIKLLKNYNK